MAHEPRLGAAIFTCTDCRIDYRVPDLHGLHVVGRCPRCSLDGTSRVNVIGVGETQAECQIVPWRVSPQRRAQGATASGASQASLRDRVLSDAVTEMVALDNGIITEPATSRDHMLRLAATMLRLVERFDQQQERLDA